MSGGNDALNMAQSAVNPDAQATVNDFLDYTDFFPSGLTRSLTLIGDLDSTYHDAVQQVHELTVLYGKLPTLPECERPQPVGLRKQIAQQLQTAINQRECALAEASRLYEVAVRHCQRLAIIKKKLQAQPQPPSRDPTPPPVSPSAQRLPNRSYERPAHLRLAFDSIPTGANTFRPRDRHRKTATSLSRRHSRAYSLSSESSGGASDARPAVGVTATPRRHSKHRDRHPKPGRSRLPGVHGTNVHSSVAGISTSNALAMLAPPPPDARPGSKWAPWNKLTQYEMAVLRKQMKKNAVWEPSLTMVNRELERKHRTMADYERERARCEETGEEFLNEEPETLQLALHGSHKDDTSMPVDMTKEHVRENSGGVSIRLKSNLAQDGLRLDRLSQRQRAVRDAQELVDATEKIREAANSLKELIFSPQSTANSASQDRRTSAEPSSKRKRETSPQAVSDGAFENTREAFTDSHESGCGSPESKRARLQLIATSPNTILSSLPSPTTDVSTPEGLSMLAAISSAPNALVLPVESRSPSSDTSTTQVPLAPAGLSTPKIGKQVSKSHSRDSSPASISFGELEHSPLDHAPVQNATSQPTMTAASSRPRRESAAPRIASPLIAFVQLWKNSKASGTALEASSDVPARGTRPRSARCHVRTPKAQSEEPAPNEANRVVRETRRHSIFSQPALTAVPSIRTSLRKKPPPKGEVVVAGHGQKTVTNVKRSQGSKNKKKKKTEGEAEATDYIDPGEPRYCICDDVSFGPMICCDNHCDKEWFHMSCVGMNPKGVPARRARWFCPECREALGVDLFGNPLVPPPLPGRRGNR